MEPRRQGIKSRKFAYHPTFFILKSFQYAMYMIAVLFLLLLFQAPFLWLAGFMALFFVLLLVFGMSPLFTAHELTARRLIVRQGWYFQLSIPLRTIKEVHPLDHGRAGLKSAFGRPAIYVTSAESGLVQIKLKKPVRLALLLGKSVDEVIINVNERERLLEMMGERLHSLQSMPSVRAPSLGM